MNTCTEPILLAFIPRKQKKKFAVLMDNVGYGVAKSGRRWTMKLYTTLVGLLCYKHGRLLLEQILDQNNFLKE